MLNYQRVHPDVVFSAAGGSRGTRVQAVLAAAVMRGANSVELIAVRGEKTEAHWSSKSPVGSCWS